MTTGTISNRTTAKDPEGEGYVKSWEQGGVRFEVQEFVKVKRDGKTVRWSSATYLLRLAASRANAKALTFVWEKGALRFDGTRYGSFSSAAEAARTYLTRGTARGLGGEAPAPATRRQGRRALAAVSPEHTEATATIPEVRRQGNHQAEDTANLEAQHRANRDRPAAASHAPVTNDSPLSDLTKLELKGIAGTAGLETRGTKEVLLATLAAAGMTTWGDTLAPRP
jgi:hypothetical protein